MSTERPRFSLPKLPGIKQEVIGEEEAFAEGAREHNERVMARQATRPKTARIRMIGGPMDGGIFPVPLPMLQKRDGTEDPELPIRVPAYQGKVVLTGQAARDAATVRHAIYRLDRSSKLLRYVRVVTLEGE
jgi:hypothetical protein